MARRRDLDGEAPPVDYGGRTLRIGDYFHYPDVGVQVWQIRNHPMVHAHAHEFREIVYVARGSAVHEVEGIAADGRRITRRCPLVPGDCFALAPGERHALRQPRRIEVYNLLFTPAALIGADAIVAGVPGMFELTDRAQLGGDAFKIHFGVDERERVLAGMQAIMREGDRRRPGFEAAMRAHFLVLMIEISRVWRGVRDATGPATGRAGPHDGIEAARAFIEETFTRALTLDEIAARSGLSPGHFSEQFKRRCGVTPTEYLADLRLERAKKLLRTTDLSIAAVAKTAGFSDGSYFARCFRSRVGETPREFRSAT